LSLNLWEDFCKEIHAARAELAAGESGPDKAIHEARRHLKRARSALKLARSALGERYSRENTRLRNIARRLSVFRDAAAMIEAFDELKTKKFPAVREGLALVKKDIESGSDPATAMRKAAQVLTPGRPWPEAAGSPAVAAKGLRFTWLQGKRALARLHRMPMPESFHELRKCVKAYRFQLRFTGAAEARIDALDQLLGEAHNLAVLDRWIAERPGRFGTDTQVAAFRRLLRERRVAVQAKSLRSADELFAGAPPPGHRRKAQTAKVPPASP
jgi:CHAD domain-containing protein